MITLHLKYNHRIWDYVHDTFVHIGPIFPPYCPRHFFQILSVNFLPKHSPCQDLPWMRTHHSRSLILSILSLRPQILFFPPLLRRNMKNSWKKFVSLMKTQWLFSIPQRVKQRMKKWGIYKKNMKWFPYFTIYLPWLYPSCLTAGTSCISAHRPKVILWEINCTEYSSSFRVWSSHSFDSGKNYQSSWAASPSPPLSFCSSS